MLTPDPWFPTHSSSFREQHAPSLQAKQSHPSSLSLHGLFLGSDGKQSIQYFPIVKPSFLDGKTLGTRGWLLEQGFGETDGLLPKITGDGCGANTCFIPCGGGFGHTHSWPFSSPDRVCKENLTCEAQPFSSWEQAACFLQQVGQSQALWGVLQRSWASCRY